MSDPRQLDSFAERVVQIAQRIRENRAAAIAGLYDLVAIRLIRFAVAITRNQHDAEDALHASLVRVAESPDLLLNARQPWHYLLTMVRNDCLQILRRRRPVAPGSAMDELWTHSPADQLELAETHRAVWVALRKLPPEQSEIVVLKIWEELTFEQIADVLEIPPPTAASRYRYALTKLAVYLQQLRGEAIHHE